MASFSDLLNLPAGNFVRSFYGQDILHPMDIIIDMERSLSEEEQGQFNIKGILDYSFSKTLSLNDANIDVAKITSKYSKGILEITLPKTEEAKPKVIPVDVTME